MCGIAGFCGLEEDFLHDPGRWNQMLAYLLQVNHWMERYQVG